MNIAHRFSRNDVAGVLGLVSFLADKDACMARMAELQGMVDSAEAELARASEASSNALQLKTEAEKTHGEVEAAKAAFGEKLAAVEAREKAAAKLAADAKAESVRRGDELSAWENARAAKEAEFKKRWEALEAEKETVKGLLDQATTLKADYEEKLSNLRAAMEAEAPKGALKVGLGKVEAQVVIRDKDGKVKYEGPMTMPVTGMRNGNDA